MYLVRQILPVRTDIPNHQEEVLDFLTQLENIVGVILITSNTHMLCTYTLGHNKDFHLLLDRDPHPIYDQKVIHQK